ncbi:uncharacterized protein BX664DRAFT_322741 [Halteromyces radiatus]|uniref:uncharacterized protein n=1 Tax=Halteromyces radiatus TaxID=101107 RepID=UPI00221E7F1A|nr:uncharacterized protein BX664DRAFT_322741 [Halteromyces radiatus]KAI8100048.1 hypothetical protein BX664DRAFT_322741 [Halteromyces radiatus]
MDALLLYDSASDEDDNDDKTTTNKNRKRSFPSDQLKLPVKRQALPQLPSFFSPIHKPSSSSQDHQGRTRSKPALLDSWPTHVYIQIPTCEQIQTILGRVTTQDATIHSMISNDNSFHLSLTKCLYLKEHQLDGFADMIQKRLGDTSRFTISFAQLSLLTNEENTRSFLTIEVGSGYNELMKQLKLVDQVVKHYGQPIFYEPPRFHASIAWSLKKDPLENIIQNSPEQLMKDLAYIEYEVSSVFIRMGNRLVKIKLR